MKKPAPSKPKPGEENPGAPSELKAVNGPEVQARRVARPIRASHAEAYKELGFEILWRPQPFNYTATTSDGMGPSRCTVKSAEAGGQP